MPSSIQTKPDAANVDGYYPNFNRLCENCGQKSTVTAIKDGKVVYEGDMCGVCTWGEAAMAEPDNWNS